MTTQKREDDPADRDLDHITPSHLDDRDRVMRIIMARCGDALTEAEIAEAFAEPEDGWAEVVPLIVDAIDALEAKLEVLERIVAGEEDDGDVDDEPGDQRQAGERG